MPDRRVLGTHKLPTAWRLGARRGIFVGTRARPDHLIEHLRVLLYQSSGQLVDLIVRPCDVCRAHLTRVVPHDLEITFRVSLDINRQQTNRAEIGDRRARRRLHYRNRAAIRRSHGFVDGDMLVPCDDRIDTAQLGGEGAGVLVVRQRDDHLGACGASCPAVSFATSTASEDSTRDTFPGAVEP